MACRHICNLRCRIWLLVSGRRAYGVDAVRHPERELQISVAGWLDIALADPCVWFHVPNGEKRSPRTAGLLKRMGVKAGVPDLFVFAPGIVVALELKAGKGRATETQEAMLDRLNECGVHTAICKSIEQVEQALRFAGVPLRVKEVA